MVIKQIGNRYLLEINESEWRFFDTYKEAENEKLKRERRIFHDEYLQRVGGRNE